MPQKPDPMTHVIQALAGTTAAAGQPWSLQQLAAWASIGRGAYCAHLVGVLHKAGFAEPLEQDVSARVRTGRTKPSTQPLWRLTPAGRAAVRSVADTDSFEQRLWRLLRIRQVLNPSDAAECLVDAGGDVVKAERAASQHLARWHRLAPSVVVAPPAPRAGRRRYVLARDIGPVPPLAAERGGPQ